MNHTVNLILKVAIASALLSVIVKYGGRFLPIAPTAVNALIAVLLPTLITGAVLLWRWLNLNPPNASETSKQGR